MTKITWRRLTEGPGYYAAIEPTLWTVTPLGPRSWAILRNGVPVAPPRSDKTAAGKPRKRRQAATQFWRTPEEAFKAAEEMIRQEAGR